MSLELGGVMIFDGSAGGVGDTVASRMLLCTNVLDDNFRILSDLAPESPSFRRSNLPRFVSITLGTGSCSLTSPLV